MSRSPEELVPALAAIDAGEVDSILTPSADYADIAQRRGDRVAQVHAGMETLYEIRATGRDNTEVRVEPGSPPVRPTEARP